MRSWFSLLICLIGLALPWRLRVWYANLLGWITQGAYRVYQAVMKILVDNLQKGKGGPES